MQNQTESYSNGIGKMLAPIEKFLLCSTPDDWIAQALKQPELLLIDHANCEKKAASTALNLMYRYVDRPDLLYKMSRLAREELRHFEQVLSIMQRRGFVYRHISPSRYAAALRDCASNHEPDKLIDTLMISAIIEARSCERFASLTAVLVDTDTELSEFYGSLLKSEARHFGDYLALARQYHDTDTSKFQFEPRLTELLEVEAGLIKSGDSEFRFHSGPLRLALA